MTDLITDTVSTSANIITGFQVYQAINKVQADLSKSGIQKTQNNTQQRYKFRGIDDIYNALSPMLAKNGLCIMPSVLEKSCVDVATKNGGKMNHVTLKVRLDFISSTDGSSKSIEVYGEAMDSGDKAINKAMTAAYKVACFQVFCIPTEGDNDTETNTYEAVQKVVTISQPKQAELVALMGSFEMPVDHFLKSWKLSSLAELHEASVENAFNWVNGQAQHKQEVINKKAAAQQAQQEPAPQQEQQAPDQEQQHQPVMNQEVADTVKKQFIEKRDGVQKFITPAQTQELRNLLEWLKFDKIKFCNIARINQLGEMTQDRFIQSMQWLMDQGSTVEKQPEPKKPMNKRFVDTSQKTQYDIRTEQYAAMSEHNQQRA